MSTVVNGVQHGNYYSASRDQITGLWSGWMVYDGSPASSIVRTPDTYGSRRAAIDAIKSQHPRKIAS